MGLSDDLPVLSRSRSRSRDRRLHLPGHHLRSRSRSITRDRLSSRTGNMGGDSDPSGGSLQDRLLAKMLTQIIPSDYSLEKYAEMTDKRKDKDRPQFSLTVMSGNFRRFNARVGVVFVFQHRLFRVLSWKHPTHTFAALAVYSFICLDPQLLAVLPVVVILLFIMVPAFIARHPPPPNSIPGKLEPYTAHGGAIAPPAEFKAVSEMSKDFFRNLRDLQNTMADFTEAHDQLIATIGPPTNFSDEKISSGIYHFLLLNCLILFISSYLIPWNLVFLLSGWFIISLLHPKVQQYLLSSSDSEFANREKRKAIDRFKTWVDRDIILDELPEVREVEIFELQRHYSAGSEWEPWIYSASPYEPLSPQRIAGHRPRGTRFFEDVKSPGGWEFKDSKWTLDLGSRTWVSERCVNGVEVEEEKERWVYDWIEGRQEHDSEGEEGREWEEGHEGGREEVSKARGRRGEWRRRRWVRAVVRKRYLKGE